MIWSLLNRTKCAFEISREMTEALERRKPDRTMPAVMTDSVVLGPCDLRPDKQIQALYLAVCDREQP